MEKNSIEAFKKMNELKPPSKLSDSIFQIIELESAKQYRKKLIFISISLFISISALVYSSSMYGSAFLKSDFWNMASLAFSDISVVAHHWKEFSLSLLETLPAITVVAVLIPFSFLLWSISLLIDLNNKTDNKKAVKI